MWIGHIYICWLEANTVCGEVFPEGGGAGHKGEPAQDQSEVAVFALGQI